MPRSPTAADASRSPAFSLRSLLVGVVVLGALILGFRYPVIPEPPWPEPHVFQPDDDVCKELRSKREWTFFEVPETERPITPAAVARKYNLENLGVERLCRANDLPEPCADLTLTPGERLVLPLHEKAVAGAREARKGLEAGR